MLIRTLFVILSLTLAIQGRAEEIFKVIVLGSQGGPRENNLSGYLIAPKASPNFIALDAGSLLNGIFVAAQQNSFQDIQVQPQDPYDLEGEILRNHIKGYLISHAHLDHVAGLVLNSTDDSKKPIFGIPFTIDNLRDYLFNWKIWPNFGSEGEKPLNQYQYHRLKPEQRIALPATEMTVEPFLLSHPDGYQSTAFLLEYSGFYAVYFGDTSPDALEPQKYMENVWKKVAPLIQQNKLRGIFLECSYTNERPNKELFGHLTPHYFMEELGRLAQLVNPKDPPSALKDLKVIVTHIKQSLLKGPSTRKIIQEELQKLNTLQVQLIFPEQGQRLEL